MTQPFEDLSQRQNVPTLPADPADPFRFGQLTETVKDCFQIELTNFFNYKLSSIGRKVAEIPTIEKYVLGQGASDTPIETFTNVILQHPDILERLPLVAITTASGPNLPLSFGSSLVDQIQPSARIRGTNAGPYALVDGDQISFLTLPKPGGQPVRSTLLFRAAMFADIGAVTAAEVIAASKAMLLYVTASVAQYAAPVGVLRFDATGPCAPRGYPNQIAVLGPPYSTPNALAELGFTVGQADQSSAHAPLNRYAMSSRITVNLDVGTEDENSRRELTDLLLYFFTLEMELRRHTFYGRSVFDDEFPGEWFQVTLLNQQALAGEQEMPRGPGGGDERDKICVNRLSVPVTIIDYVDRAVTTPPRRGPEATLTRSRTDADPLPAGDHGGGDSTSG